MWESHRFFWTRSDPTQPFWFGLQLFDPKNSGKALHCSCEQWRRDRCKRTRKRRRKRVGKGWRSDVADGGAGGSSSKRGGRALGSCFTSRRFFFFFFFFSVCFSSGSSSSIFSVLFIFASAPPPLCFLPFSFVPLRLFFLVLSSMFTNVFLYSLLSVSSFFFFFLFSPPKLPKSVVSIPPSSLFFTSPVISSFFGRVPINPGKKKLNKMEEIHAYG